MIVSLVIQSWFLFRDWPCAKCSLKSSAFHFILPLFDRISLLVIISYSEDPKTRIERALPPFPQACSTLHPRLRPKQPRELPCNMQMHVARISSHVLLRRSRRSELRVSSLVSGSSFLEIYRRRACAGVGFCSEWVRFPALRAGLVVVTCAQSVWEVIRKRRWDLFRLDSITVRECVFCVSRRVVGRRLLLCNLSGPLQLRNLRHDEVLR